MRFGSKHVTLAALAALSALVIHQVAYLFAYPLSGAPAAQVSDHSHLSTQWALVTPVAVLAAAAFVLRQVRQLNLTAALDRRALAALGALLFVGQEVIEAASQTGGLAALAGNPALYAGVVVAPLVALVVARVIRQASDLAARFLSVVRPVIPPRRAPPRPSGDAPARLPFIASSSARGPPPLLRL